MIAAWNLFTPLWFMWGLIFLIIESTAIWARSTGRIKDGGTLSSLVWRFIHHRGARAFFAVAWTILTVHFFFEWP
jgi:hypothetical protein